MSRWLIEAAAPHVAQAVVCDPKENFAISRSNHKCDQEDAFALAKLHRLGAIKEVWHSPEEIRAVFKCSVLAYVESVKRHTVAQLQLKARFRQWGIIPLGGSVYSQGGRNQWLCQIASAGVRDQLRLQYETLDHFRKNTVQTRRQMCQAGRDFPEIELLRTVPGVGRIGAHVFVGYIQDPRRFSRPQQLYRYCRLGIRDRSSDNKPLGHQRLDRNGHGQLKALSYRAWLTAMKHRQSAVCAFYQQSLARTGNKIHARLNTQRKTLQTMWWMWRRQEPFGGERFLSSATQAVRQMKCD